MGGGFCWGERSGHGGHWALKPVTKASRSWGGGFQQLHGPRNSERSKLVGRAAIQAKPFVGPSGPGCIMTEAPAADGGELPQRGVDEKVIDKLADGLLQTYRPLLDETLAQLSELRANHVNLLGTMSEEDRKLLGMPHY